MLSQAAETPLAGTPLIDPIAIERLRSVAGQETSGFVAEMAQLFLEETAKSLDDVRTGCDRGDWKAVTRLSHSLKSSSATLGLMRLARACEALELDTQNLTSSPETELLVAAVFDEFQRAAPILKQLV